MNDLQYQPKGKWKCLACGTVWDGEQLHPHPDYHGTWTCWDYFCGATCVPVSVEDDTDENDYDGLGASYAMDDLP